MMDWSKVAKKSYLAIKKEGMPIVIVVHEKDGSYNITTGKRKSFEDRFKSHGIIKEIDIDTVEKINPEMSEIIFHAGKTDGDIPDLTDKDTITIEADRKVFNVTNLRSIRPAGTTLLYKAFIKESSSEL